MYNFLVLVGSKQVLLQGPGTSEQVKEAARKWLVANLGERNDPDTVTTDDTLLLLDLHGYVVLPGNVQLCYVVADPL